MSEKDGYKPGWVPEINNDAFFSKIRKGIKKNSKEKKTVRKAVQKRKELTLNDYVEGVLKKNKTVLARTITLLESNSADHYEKARSVLKKLLPYSGQSIRIGITGIPGSGKSTLIDTLGCFLIEKGHKVAVLAVDPSSRATRGSILGDKTRMDNLAKEANCFIRPSPTGGTLGGVTRKTRETILVCEAAGYDVILIETVGVGQSEITVRSMVDFFLLVLIAGAGDELQGIKNYLAGVFVLENSSRVGIIGQLSFLDLHGLPDFYLTKYVQNIYKVTPENVQQITKKLLRDEEMSIVIVGDIKNILDRVIDYLQHDTLLNYSKLVIILKDDLRLNESSLIYEEGLFKSVISLFHWLLLKYYKNNLELTTESLSIIIYEFMPKFLKIMDEDEKYFNSEI